MTKPASKPVGNIIIGCVGLISLAVLMPIFAIIGLQYGLPGIRFAGGLVLIIISILIWLRYES